MADASRASSAASEGPLGILPGLTWDAERQRYFKHLPPQGAAAAGGERETNSRSGDSAATPSPPVTAIPVAESVIRSMRVVRWRRQGGSRPYAEGRRQRS